MQRQHPLLSPTGLAMTLIVLVVLAVAYWRTGGRMFSPGSLASAHVEIEECAECHQPLAAPQAESCMNCHTEIRMELNMEDGLHARLRAADQCRVCHPDHRGVDFDLHTEAVRNFDHGLTFFSLNQHTLDYDSGQIECADCHTTDDYQPDENACAGCHSDHDPDFMTRHTANFSPNCLACHDGFDTMADFNHAETLFPLSGEHSETACADCHTRIDPDAAGTAMFAGLSTQCTACHAEPALHAGLFQSTCEDCHTPTGWSPALLNGTSFDHFTETGFSLVKHDQDYDGSLLDCAACHIDSLSGFEENVCAQCHTSAAPDFMAGHTADFGTSCLECHDGVDSMEDFDHAAVFVLDGAHGELDCAACHVTVSADGLSVHTFSGTPADCAGCHAEPEIHAGVFGLQCENCHSTAAWQPAALTSHTFPLDHGDEGEIACETCHVGTFTQYTCDACHEPAEMVEEHNEEGIFNIAGRCIECHPTGLEDEAED